MHGDSTEPWLPGGWLPIEQRPKRPGNVPKRRRRVAERDGWRCHLCGEDVSRKTLTSIDPMRASLDHIIPWAYGGGWTLDNLLLTHAGCNSARGSAPAGIDRS